MSEGYRRYEGGELVITPWDADLILDMADAEVGPACCDDSYLRIRAVMAAAPDLLEALEGIISALGGWGGDRSKIDAARYAIAKARGEA